MARKRITTQSIEKLEAALDINFDAAESAVFGVCDMQQNVIKRLKMTASGVYETNEESTILIPERLEKLLYPQGFERKKGAPEP